MKHTKRSAMTLLLAAALLLSGCAKKEPAPAPGTDLTASADSSNDNSSADPESSASTPSEPGSADFSQSTTSSEEATSSEGTDLWSSYLADFDLKGEELIEKFEWPYDDVIDLSGMTAKTEKIPGTIEDIPLAEISNDFSWLITCDYGYLAMIPETGNEYEYKKYKAGDKIGDLTVAQISTWFSNTNFEFMKYFSGAYADFEGDIVLTGEISIEPEEYPVSGEIKFYPDEESRKKLPVVNFMPLPNMPNYEQYSYDNLIISLGDRKNYPEIDFKSIPEDGTRVKVEVKIKDYGYRALFGLPFLAGAAIVDGGLEIL